jgi:lysophospholipase L1-like esterase
LSRRFVANLLLAGASLALTLGVIEAAVRILVDFDRQKPFAVYDVDHEHGGLSFLSSRSRHYAAAEFSFDAHYNAFGRRDVEWPPETVADPNSVLFIGDSFAYGIGVEHEDTLPSQLEAHLAAAGRPVEVMNFGMPGNGAPPAYARMLDDAIGKGFAARTVVVAIFVGNDFYPDVLADPGAKRVEAPAPRRPSLLSHWKTLTFLRLRVSQSARLVGWALTASRWLGVSLYDSAGTYIFLREQTPEQQALFRRIVGYVGRMKERCDETRRRLVVLILPNRIQVENRDALTGGVYDAARANRDIVAYCDEIGVACLDLLPVLSERFERDGEPLFYAIDRHLNRLGYRVVGEEVARFLLAEGLPGAEGAR